MSTETQKVDVVPGILRNPRTQMYHRGRGNASFCNHSGSRRIPQYTTVTVSLAERASESLFCRKCFPHGKPDIAALSRVGGAA